MFYSCRFILHSYFVFGAKVTYFFFILKNFQVNLDDCQPYCPKSSSLSNLKNKLKNENINFVFLIFFCKFGSEE